MTREPIASRLVRAQRLPLLGRLAREILQLWGCEIPASVTIGVNFRLYHRGNGVVFNPNVVVGDHVTVYHNVTIARSDSWMPVTGARPPAMIADDVVLCPGVVILNGPDGITLGRGTIVGANSTLTCSTGEWEVWAGSPARRISSRKVGGN